MRYQVSDRLKGGPVEPFTMDAIDHVIGGRPISNISKVCDTTEQNCLRAYSRRGISISQNRPRTNGLRT